MTGANVTKSTSTQASRATLPVAQRCAGNSETTTRLVNEVLARRTWALHRHVHLVRAFDEAFAAGPIATALSIGCGAGLSELFLAASYPDVHFTLTDFDESRLAIGRRRVQDLHIKNVSFGSLDLLGDIGEERYDWVSSIEVLEHIQDDATAARNLVALSRDWFWVLVPGCSDEDLRNERLIRRVWENCEHYRPGYTADTLTGVLDGDIDVVWVRPCYRDPAALNLRQRMKEATNQELVEDRTALVQAACEDLDGPADAVARGIEVLGRVRRGEPR
jgi:hypothetical protein